MRLWPVWRGVGGEGRAAVIALAALILLSPPSAAEPASPAPEKLALDEALRRALSRNPSVELSQRELERSDALVREARAAWLPTLTAGLTGARLDDARTLAGREIQGAGSVSGNLSLAVPIVAPQRWSTWSHVAENARVQRLSAADVRRQVGVATARAYLAIVAQQRLLDVTDRAWRTAQSHHAFARQRLEGGVGNRLDEIRAAQEVATTSSQAAAARAGLVRTQEALGILTGSDAPVDAAGAPVLGDLPPPAQALEDVKSARTDVGAAQARRDAAERVLRDSWIDFLPVLGGQFVPFFQNPATATQPERGWQALLVLSIPLYDGGLRYGQKSERAALAAQAGVNLEATLRQARSEVRTAFAAVQGADDALVSARQAAELAATTLKLATTAYEAGATTNLEVVDAERRARDAESAAAIAEDASRQARVDVLAASGRFP